MKNIAGKSCFSVKDLVDFSGFSRSYISTLIAKTKEGKLSPPLPFYDFVTNKRHKICIEGQNETLQCISKAQAQG